MGKHIINGPGLNRPGKRQPDIVHISNVHEGERIRQRAIVPLHADAAMAGFDVERYELALTHVVSLVA